MASELWGWMVDLMGDFKNSTERVAEWTKNNLERRREQNRKASKKYWQKKLETDPEYVEAHRRQNAKQMRKYREKKKLEKLAKEKGQSSEA